MAARLLRSSSIAVVILTLAACARPSGSTASPPSPTPSAASSVSPTGLTLQSVGPGIAIAVSATATVTFRAGTSSREYQLASGSNPRNALDLESRQAFLDLGTTATQELSVTVIGGGAPGATLKGPSRVLASFDDSVAHVGGIATVGQGTCTLTLSRFGQDGMAGMLDCEDVAPVMGAASPVSFQASLDAVPA